MTEGREEMESIELHCFTPKALYLDNQTISQRDLRCLRDEMNTWEGIAKDILTDAETAGAFREVTMWIIEDVCTVHRALTHIAGGGNDVAVSTTCEVSGLDLARLLTYLGDKTWEFGVEGAAAAIAAVIRERFDEPEEAADDPEPTQDDGEDPDSEIESTISRSDHYLALRKSFATFSEYAEEHLLQMLENHEEVTKRLLRRVTNRVDDLEEGGFGEPPLEEYARMVARITALEEQASADPTPSNWQVPEAETAGEGDAHA